MKRLIAAALAFTLLGTGAAQASTLHTVQPTDSLWSIGQEEQVPHAVIQRANGLASDLIIDGQTLQIPERYVVQPGDTLWKLAQRFDIPLSTIRYVNNKWDSLLLVGQVLYLPTPTENAVALSPADVDLFERLVSAESKGQPFEGQVAVANVVLNRVKSPDFPDTVREVITQYYGSVPAFSPVDNGQIDLPAVESAKEAVRVALAGYDYSNGAEFFYNPDLTSPDNWIRSREVTTGIGDHLFAK